MPAPHGFTYETRCDDEVVIFHHGRVATTLRGRRALEFLTDVGDAGGHADGQELMARLTGNYKRGNERMAAQHPRNRRRGA
ncbi:MAG: hypothetical protein WCC60_07960 [Ilumatobacteraceae bacterium]